MNLKDIFFEELRNNQSSINFLKGSTCTKQPCETCRAKGFCHGGYRRQNVCYLTDTNCAHQKILEYILPRLKIYAKISSIKRNFDSNNNEIYTDFGILLFYDIFICNFHFFLLYYKQPIPNGTATAET